MSPADVRTPAAHERTAAVLPRVAAILVVHNGGEWLASVLSTLAGQRYPALDLVVVDNASTDASAEILARRIPADRLITLTENRGFTGAIAAALEHEAVAGADHLLLLHDDLALAPNAVGRLVQALHDDPSMAIVGPKLREWSEDKLLQQVGMRLDRFGRAEADVEPGELDQGQRDDPRDVLWVSTAGMLIRREVLTELGGLDERFTAFRDDADLCWRAWLLGHRVGVAPAAVGYHVAAGFRGDRFGRRTLGSRYLAERNGLASVLANTGRARLLWLLPTLLGLLVVKVIGFLATRRIAAAAAVLRAYGWNLRHLPGTLRRRRDVQRRRLNSDRDLDPLFAVGLPRFRVYIEAAGDWLAGGSTSSLYDDASIVREDASGSWLARQLRRHPVGVAGVALAAVYLIGLIPLLGGGQIVGGQIAPWPEDAMEFVRAYSSPWNGEPLASEAFASPIQALLGFVSLLGFGSAWLAQRLIVFGLLPLGWMLAVRAGRLVTSWPAPRILGGTLYVLSPPVLGALAGGRFGTLVTAALLPGLVLVGARCADPATGPARAWRAVALLALGSAIVVAASPGLAPVLGVGLVALALLVGRRIGARRGWRPPVRLAVAVGAGVALLAPWVAGILAAGEISRPPAAEVGLPFWRAVLVVPEVLPGLGGTAGIVVAATTAAVIAAGVLLGLRLRPGAVAGFVLVGVGGAYLAWAAARLQIDLVWPPALLLPTALAYAGLAVVAGRCVVPELRERAFGLRQIVVVVSTVVLTVGLVGGIVRLGTGPYADLARAPELVPAFVTADEPRVGPYRVLLLDAGQDTVRWDVVGAQGPSMLAYGASFDRTMTEQLDALVGELSGGADPRAGSRLGVLNVRYVVVADDSDGGLIDAIGRQPALEPLPSGGGRVFRVQTWLPRAVVLPPGPAQALLRTGDPGPTEALEETGLTQISRDRYSGEHEGGEEGLLVVTEATSELWRAGRGTGMLDRAEVSGVNAFTVPPDTEQITARVAGGTSHRLQVALQVLLVLGLLSFALRPPGFARERRAERRGGALPADFETEQPDSGAAVTGGR